MLESLFVKTQFPIVVEVDNVGAIYLSYWYTTSQKTKHVDTWVHFVRESVEEGILKVVFIRSSDNDSDIFTKNTVQATFLKHRDKMVGDVNKA